MNLRSVKRRHYLHMPFVAITPMYFCFQSGKWKKFKESRDEQ